MILLKLVSFIFSFIFSFTMIRVYRRFIINRTIEVVKKYTPEYNLFEYAERTDKTGLILHGREIQKCAEIQHYKNLIKDLEKL